MLDQRVLMLILVLSCGGLVAAPPRDAGSYQSASARLTLTIPPKVALSMAPQVDLGVYVERELSLNEALCLTSNGATEYRVTTVDDSGARILEMPGADSQCPRHSSSAFGLQLPAGSTGVDNQVTLLVSAE